MKFAVLVGPSDTLGYVYAQGRMAELDKISRLSPIQIEPEKFAAHEALLSEVQVIFTTWGFPSITAKQLDRLPKLEAVFYAAGSVQSFARPLVERGIKVVSAWRGNGVPVAEFTLAQILLACKGYNHNVRDFKSGAPHHSASRGPGVYGETVALLGFGAIGQVLRDLLRGFNLKFVVFDPFLSEEAAAEADVRKVTLEEAFATGYVVSNHLANKPETVGMINEALLARMRPGATFINTGRGATVVEGDLATVMAKRRDLTALLDVTDPEPVSPQSPLMQLPNIVITTHIAGSINDEVVRLADYCIEDYKRFVAGVPMVNEVTLEMLATMA
ncbi:MAG TPA: hydroxyacid dehydrogenase [Capsulimonadaceae bacterium]|jgi:phosphoglycerate dehydrogenase-like enzyme